MANGDINPPPIEHERLAFVKTDVTQWAELRELFKHANKLHGRIDHVFANAGIAGRANYLEDRFDDHGELLEPSALTLDINLKAVINTCYIGLHYMRKQTRVGGSIVLTASGSSFQRFRVADYTTAKHGVLGFMRGMIPNLQAAELPIRINALAPSWTLTGLVPEAMVNAFGDAVQTPDVVARSAAVLMADKSRQGQMIYSVTGRFFEIEEGMLLKTTKEIVGEVGDDKIVQHLLEMQSRAQHNPEEEITGNVV